MEFSSQICTSRSQSERLLALGLNPNTADMGLIGDIPIVLPTTWANADPMFDTPAWSLHRLIEMLNNTQFGMTIGIYRDEVTFAEDLFEVYDNTYDNLISVIEWLIGLGKFNKEYLKE